MQALCSICQEHHPILSFRFLPCGHGFCQHSLEQFCAPARNARRPCPICRVNFKLDSAHCIYIEDINADVPFTQDLPEGEGESEPQLRYSKAVLKQAAYASNKVEQITADSSAEIAYDAGYQIEKTVTGIDQQYCNVKALLTALAALCRRIAPVFDTISTQKKELASMRKDLRAVDVEQRRLRGERDRAKRLAESAVETADKARHGVTSLREENEKLRECMEAQAKRHAEQLADFTKEASGLRDTILAHKDKEAKQKSKIAALRQQISEHESAIPKPREATRMALLSRVSRWQAESQSAVQANPTNLNMRSSCTTDDATIPDSESELELVDAEPEPLQKLPALLPTRLISRLEPPVPQKPIFATDWNLKPPENRKRKRVASTETHATFGSNTFPIALDEKGRPKGSVQLGSRQKLRFG